MPSLYDYTQQSAFSDPREYAPLLTALPADQPADLQKLAAVGQNLINHYRASKVPCPPERLGEVDSRWLDRLLACDRSRFDVPLDAPRAATDRVAGCCRDFTLLTVAALRARGVPARSRVGFAAYFDPDFHHDHVITEYWDGERWVFADTEIAPVTASGRTVTAPGNPVSAQRNDWPAFDALDLPLGETVFETAAQVWTRFRRGEIDVDRYGVAPDLPLRGAWFVRNYVIQELAHRQRDELLLWDIWGEMSLQLDGDLGFIDEIACLLLVADSGDAVAERELAERYAADSRLHPGDRVLSHSPRGVVETVDLRLRDLVRSPAG